MKKISFFLSSLIITGMLFTSCVKDRNVGPDFSSTDPVLELRTPISNIAGLANFGRAVIGNLPDTEQFYVNLASAYSLDHDISVTIAVDASQIDTYNADDANVLKYELLPDSDYAILKTAGTIVKGQRVDSFQVAFFKDKIDGTKNYMLPVSITDGSGVLISGNQSTIWFHAIGNPLAGNWYQSFYRWNDVPDTTGPPNSTVFEDELTGINPINATTLDLPESYTETFAGVGVSLSFRNNGGVLSDFDAFFDDVQEKAMTAALFTIVTAPKLVSYQVVGDASTHYAGTTVRIYLEVINSSGGNRKVVDEFVKQ
jgi:hypothetical protein